MDRWPRKTRRKGVTQLAQGKFRVRAWAVDPKSGQSRESQRIVEGTFAEACAEQDRIRAATRGGAESRRQRVTLATYAATWIRRGKAKGRRWSTRTTQAYVLELHVRPWLGDYFVDAITPSDVEAWLEAMAGRTDNPRNQPDERHPHRDGRYDPVTIDLWLQKLRAVVAAYYDEFQLGPSPLLRIERPRRASSKPRRENALTAEQAGALLAHCRETRPQWFGLLYLLLTTGARIGEMTALRWVDVDETEGAILVHRGHVCGHEGDTKTGRSRVLPLTQDMRDVLAWHQRRLLDERFAPAQLVGEGAARCERERCGRLFRRPRRTCGEAALRFCYPCRQSAGAAVARDRSSPTGAEAEASGRIRVSRPQHDLVTWLETHPRAPSRRDGTAAVPELAEALVFPSTTGGLQRPAGVHKALAAMSGEIGVPRISPNGTRRTFNDLLRRSGTDGVLLRAMTGHGDERMTAWYSVIRTGDGAREVSALIRSMRGPAIGPDGKPDERP